MVKIVSLNYYLDENSLSFPSVKERINKIEETLELNKDTDILICSEMYIARIKNNKFTYVYEEKITSETKIIPRHGEVKDLSGINQNSIRKSGEYASEPEITERLIDISNKYPNVLIISGTTLSYLIERDTVDNKTYILKQGNLKTHYKMDSHKGLSDLVSDELYEKLENSSYFRNKSGKIEDVTFNYMDKDFMILLQICADAEKSVEGIKFEHPEKLNLRIILSYLFSNKPQTIVGADYDILIDGGHGLVVYDNKDVVYDDKGKIKPYYSSVNVGINKIHVDMINLTKKYVEPSSSHEYKYLKYKNKYLKLKNLMTNLDIII